MEAKPARQQHMHGAWRTVRGLRGRKHDDWQHCCQNQDGLLVFCLLYGALCTSAGSNGLLSTMKSHVHLAVLMCGSSDSYGIFHHPCVKVVMSEGLGVCAEAPL